MTTHILIATPCATNNITTQYLHTIVDLLHYKHSDKEISYELSIHTLTLPDIYQAKNLIAAKFMNESKFTHLLFIDSDMGFSHKLLIDMLKFDKPFIGAMSPSRHFNRDKYFSAANTAKNSTEAEAYSLDFILSNSLYGENINGFFKTCCTGTGILLLKREVFELLRNAYPELLFTSSAFTEYSKDGTILQCFSPIVENQQYLSEDISFCKRWREINGIIWVSVNHPVTHVGIKEYTGIYKD